MTTSQEAPRGWYPHPDGSRRVVFHNGIEFIDPLEVFEKGVEEELTHLAKRMFEAGYNAGADAAARLIGSLKT